MLLPSIAAAQDASDTGSRTTSVTEVDEIVVTGRSLSELGREAYVPVQLLAGDELMHRRQSGLGETLAGLPGVHLDNYGGGASRPVIRGQTVPRIEILSDGANLFDASSVSPDHAIATDPLLLDGIEIQRGPGAVRYGGNATYGAINLIDGKTPRQMPQGGLSGGVEARYGTGDEEMAVVGRVTAALGPVAVHAEGARRVAENYDVPDSYGSDRLPDSFAEGTSYAFGTSLITSNGYVGAAYTRQENEYGLPGHSHAGAACHFHLWVGPGMDLHCVPHGGYVNPIPTSDDLTARIKLTSDRYDLRADFDDPLPGFSHIRVRGSYTDYRHDEIDGPTLFGRYTNEVWDGRVELTHRPVLGFVGTFGVQYTDGTFGGLDVLDLAAPVPAQSAIYVTKNIAVFVSERRSFGPVDVEIAARQDWREITGSLYLPPLEHNPFSASAAATWNIGDGYALSLAYGHTERAPSVREIYSANSNLATNSFEMGLSVDLRTALSFLEPHYPDFVARLPAGASEVMEETDAVNLTFRRNSGPTQFEVGVYHQRVDNYIFARLIETDVETNVALRWLIYTPVDAEFTGIDGQISHQLSPESRATVFGDYVQADLKGEDDNLPRIPPGRLGARYEWERGPVFAEVEYYRTFDQDRVASYESKTHGYNMINATLSYELGMGADRTVDLYLRGTNLTDELAFAHTSFVKDQSPLRGRNLVFGMRHRF